MAKISALGSNVIAMVIEYSFSLALSLDQTTVTTEHMLLSTIQLSSQLRRYLTSQGVDVATLSKDLISKIQENSKYLKNHIPNSNPEFMTGQLTAEVTSLIENIYNYAKSEGREIDLADVLLGLLNLRETYASYFMSKYGITEDIILATRKGMSVSTALQGGGAPNGQKQGSAGALDEYCENLNEKAKNANAEPLIGRDKEIYTIAHTLSKKKKCNVLLVGEPGVGKTMILEGLAHRINKDEVPKPLKGKIIYSVNVGSLVAGSKYRGDYEEKITEILEEAEKRPEVILYIDEADKMDAGDGKGQMGLGLSSMIKPYLSRGNLKVAASTTWEGLRQTFEKDNALMRRFRVVNVSEPSPKETVEILKGLRKTMEEFHGVTITDSAIEAAVEMPDKYQPDKHRPDKSIDILDSACARKKVDDDGSIIVDRANIIVEITDLTGIKVKTESTDDNDSKRMLQLADRLKTVVFHQDTAIETVSKKLVISQAGLKKSNKPIGSFLFVGPSGVGKTMLANELANDLNMKFYRYNMSEYMEKHSVAKLIGAPPGYIGFGDGAAGEGKLVNDIIQNPSCVILMDEVEKAHPDVFNVCLQMLDYGQIAGGTGKVADCRNVILIMTSNLGTREGAKSALGFAKEKTGKTASSKAVEEFFLTEMRGRLSGIVEFDDLDEVSYRRIVVEKFNDMAKLVLQRNLKIVPSEALITNILGLNNSKEYGARNIEKVVSDLVEYPLSIKLLSNEIPNGSTVSLDWVNDALEIGFTPAKVPVEDTLEK